jgi:hypothetical protein
MPDDFDNEVPMPFRSRASRAYRCKGRLLANPTGPHPDPDVMSVPAAEARFGGAVDGQRKEQSF